MKHAAHNISLLLGALILLRAPRLFAQPSAAATAAFNTYAAQLESRLARQHHSSTNFLAFTPATYARLHSGELLIENLTPASQRPDALLHHWRATAFVPNGTPAAFEHLLRDFSAYPHNFAPQVVSATVLSSTLLTSTPSHTLLRLRTRKHHVITVVLDTTCDLTFASLDSTHGYSISRSTRVDQISPTNIDGLLYFLNTYWSWEQRDGGLYIQLESLSLTRAVPHGLAWAVQPLSRIHPARLTRLHPHLRPQRTPHEALTPNS